VNIGFGDGGKMIEKYRITPKMLLIGGFIIYLLFGIGDIVTTYYALQHGGYEGNPLSRYIISLGWGIALFFKIIQFSVTMFLINWAYQKNKEVSIAALYTINGIFMMTVLGNIFVINSL